MAAHKWLGRPLTSGTVRAVSILVEQGCIHCSITLYSAHVHITSSFNVDNSMGQVLLPYLYLLSETGLIQILGF